PKLTPAHGPIRRAPIPLAQPRRRERRPCPIRDQNRSRALRRMARRRPRGARRVRRPALDRRGASRSPASFSRLYWGLAAAPVGGTLGGFLIGLIADAELSRGLGVQAGLFSIAGFAVGQAGRHLIREHVVLQLALLFFGTLFIGLGRLIALVPSDGIRSLLFSVPMLLRSALFPCLLR